MCSPASVRFIRAAALIAIALAEVPHAHAQRPRITPEQTRALGRDLVLPGGVYRIRPVPSNHCLGEARTLPPVVPHLEQMACGASPTRLAEWVVLPDPARGYTIRIGRFPNGCATLARGVVLGPKAIDLYSCEGPRSDSCALGADDQIFQFLRRASGTFAIVPYPGGTLDGCFDVRASSLASGAEIILYDCHDGANQRFRMEFVGPIADANLLACARQAGWRPTPDGLRRAVPVQGVNLPFGDYASATTVDDGGVECQQRCLDDTRCRAWTWVQRQGNTPAMCWLKDDVPAPEPNERTSAGIVRP